MGHKLFFADFNSAPTMSNKKPRSSKYMNLDKNSDSIIEVDELKPLLIQIGYGDLDDEGIQKIIDIFDENGDGEMDFLEFIEFFSYVCKNLVKKNPKASYLKYLFEDSDSE